MYLNSMCLKDFFSLSARYALYVFISSLLASVSGSALAQPTPLTRVSYASRSLGGEVSADRLSQQDYHDRRSGPRPIVNTRFLEEIAARFNIPVSPVYAFESSSDAEAGTEVLGVRESAVWDVRVSGKLMALRKLGSMVASDDGRLRSLEASVSGSRILVAYESPAGELTAVLLADQGLYSARRLQDKSIAISRVSSQID